ncbi:hypothetical protein KI387_029785, partial [Taxus chinensis]
GKDRYPYPIGYQATRNHVGQMYKMEIQEGNKGPAFVVISEEGISCLGETPTIAWEKVQRKKNMWFQKRHRNQFSRVDGAELFGFTNPLVQRLFRELLANENGIAKQSDVDIFQNGGTPGLGFGKPPPVTTEGSKRKKRLKLVKRKAVGTVSVDSPKSNKDFNGPATLIQSGDFINQSYNHFDVTGEIGLCVPDTLDALQDRKALNAAHMMKDSKMNFNGIMNNKDDTACVSVLSDLPGHLIEMQKSHVKHGEPLEACIKNPEVNEGDQSIDVNLGNRVLEGCELKTNCTQTSMVKDELQSDSLSEFCEGETKEVIDAIHDDDELLKDDKANQCGFSTSVISLEVNPETHLIEPIIPKECNLNLSQQVTQCSATQSSDGNFDKGDSDSMGQELAKSMMTVLLPQVLPLLKQAGKKNKKIKSGKCRKVSPLGKHDPNLESLNEWYKVRKETENFSSEMHVVSNLHNFEHACIHRGLSFGRTVTDCSPGTESQFLCTKASIEENTSRDTYMPRTGEKITLSDAVFSHTDSVFENTVSVCKVDHTGRGPSLTKQCPDKEMSSMQPVNVLQVSKVGDTAMGEAGIEQKLYESKFGETTDKVNKSHREELFAVASNPKEKHVKQGQCFVVPFIDQPELLEKHSSKPAHQAGQGLEIDVALASERDVYSRGVDDKFNLIDKYNKNEDLGTAEHDSAVIECVVPDSFEDEQYFKTNVKRNSYFGELPALLESHILPIVNAGGDSEALGKASVILGNVSNVQKFGFSTDNMDIDLKIKSSLLLSAEFDVKGKLILEKRGGCKAIRGIYVNDAIANRLSTEDKPLIEFHPEKSEKCEFICVSDPYTVSLILDHTHDEGDQFRNTQHAFVSQSEQMAKCEFTGQDLCIPGNDENIRDEKSQSVGCECKAGWSCGPQDQFYRRNVQPWISGTSGTGDPRKGLNDAYSTKEQQARDLSHDLVVTSGEVNISVPCCQTSYDGWVHGRVVDHISFDKKLAAEENMHMKSCGQLTDKEGSHGVSTFWADGNLDVSQKIFKEKPNFKFPEQTLGITIGASHCKQAQNSDKLSGIDEAFHSTSNLEMYPGVIMGVANHQGVDYFGDAITGKINSISYEDVKSVSCCQSVHVQSLSTNLKGFQTVSTFSDVRPSILRPKTVLKNSCPKDICPNQDAEINSHGAADENKQDIQSIELVGCYEHPIPVISMALSVQGEDIHLCVVCGLPQGRERNLFIYKVVIRDASENCSYLLGYIVVILPDVEGYFDTKSTFDRYGIQLTPDGKNLILLESIKVQDLSEPSMNCLQSQCVSQGQCEGHGVKLVSVKDGHVSLLTRLSSMESMYCILVSAPQSIIAAGQNGSVHVWNMDISWRMCSEEFVLPSSGHTSSIWELLAVPRLSHLIIGHDCNGYYVIWDVSRRLILSKFCSVEYKIFQSFVLGTVMQNGHDDMSVSFTDCELLDKFDNRKDLKDNMVPREQDESRMEGNDFPCLHSEDNIAVCLLVLAVPYKDEVQRNQAEYCDELKQKGLWRFALLENSVFLVGSTLDERASAASILYQSGVMGTSEGYIYTWEAMTGRKVFASRDFEGVGISCISANQISNAFAVAGADHR